MRPKNSFPSVATAWPSAGDGMAFAVTRRVRDGLPLRPIACGIPGPATRLRKAPERSSLRELGSR